MTVRVMLSRTPELGKKSDVTDLLRLREESKFGQIDTVGFFNKQNGYPRNYNVVFFCW